MYICVTEVDAITGVPCTIEPQRNGPSMPSVKNLQIKWVNSSAWPIKTNAQGVYESAPKYFGTCDDDADTAIAGVLEVLSEQDFLLRRQEEFEARRPFPSWLLDENSGQWSPPIPRPADAIMNGGNVAYRWNEETISWVPL